MRVVPFRVHLCTRVYAGAASRGTYVHMKASPLIASICSLAPMPRHSITKEPKPASRTNGHTIPVNYLHTRLSLLHFSVLDGVSSKKKHVMRCRILARFYPDARLNSRGSSCACEKPFSVTNRNDARGQDCFNHATATTQTRLLRPNHFHCGSPDKELRSLSTSLLNLGQDF